MPVLSRLTWEANLLKFGMIAATMLSFVPPALGQVGGAGGQLQQIPPPPALPKSVPDIETRSPNVEQAPAQIGEAVRVHAVRITGATLFSEATLLAAGKFTPDSQLNLGELRAIAGRIARYYHERGYFLTQAYLPEQTTDGDVVTIAVLEGRYGTIGVNNKTNLSDRVPRSALAGLKGDDIVSSAALERRLLLLSDLPGVVVKSTLSPGAAIGTSDLMVNLTPGRRVNGSIEADNAGNRYTGAYRLGGTINFNNPAGIGDLLSLRVLASTSGLAYGRGAYQVPIGNLTVGAAFAHIRYDFGREFKSLDAHGTADIASLYASYPLIRSRRASLYATSSVEAKWFNDRIGLTSMQSRKRSNVATIGFNGDWQDRFGGGGRSTASAGWSFGQLDIRSPLDRAADALTARSDGNFAKIQFAAARLQTVSGPLSLYASVRGQIAFDNLDSSEKMELGGAYGVRAYPEGEAYGDEGYVATAEARVMLGSQAGNLPGQLQAIAFIDVGQVDYANEPWFTGSNSAHRSGVGGGLNWFGPGNFIAKASYAHKLGDAAATSAPDRSGRFWFQIVKLF